MSGRFVSTLRVIAIMGGLLGLAAGSASAQCLANELQKLTASNASLGDHFGISVCVQGNVLIVGSNLDDDNGLNSGAAYVFGLDGGEEPWIEQQKLTAADAEPMDHFGQAISMSGDLIVVGSWADDDACPKNVWCQSGSAYVFRYDPDSESWVQEQKLTASDATEYDYFGWAVSIWGDVAMIGAKLDDDPDRDTGSVYVFRYDPVTQTWQEEQKLIPSDRGRFGTSVSLQGDVALIGASVDSEQAFQGGAAYIFRYDPKTKLWVEEQKLLLSDPGRGDIFGSSVSLSGDFALIGAPGHTVNGLGGAGAAYIFEFNPDKPGWVEQQQLTASTPGFFNHFGLSVSLQDNIAVIGTPTSDDREPTAGSVSIFVYDPKALQWTEQATLHSSDLEIADLFGTSVSIGGDQVIIGARWDDDDGSESGSAYVFGGFGDCNDNGELDLCDITDGTSRDDNNNGLPDECEPPPCPWDLDGSGAVGIADLLSLLTQWGADPGGPPDFDGNGTVGVSDLLTLLANWGPCL